MYESSAGVYGSSGSQFFRTTTGIQSRPDIKVGHDLLNQFGVAGIILNFTLNIESKEGKEIPESSKLEFSEKLSANNFSSSTAENNTSETLNRAGIANFPSLRTLLAIH